MRSVDQKESFSPLGKAIPAPAPPAPAPAVDGKFIRHPDGTVGTNIPKPPAPPYTLQGMWGRDQKANPSLKWVGEAADKWRTQVEKVQVSMCRDLLIHGTAVAKLTVTDSSIEYESIAPADFGPLNFTHDDAWRGIHAQQAADMRRIMDQFYTAKERGQLNELAEWLGRKADRD